MPDRPEPLSPVVGQAVDDLRATVDRAIELLGAADPGRWQNPAGTLRWTCWETVEHLADDLLSYAAQVVGRAVPPGREVALDWTRRRPDGPANVVFADPRHGPQGLLEVLDACAGLLVSVASTAAPDARAHHVHGAADPAGFATMGTVETLVHTYDVAQGLDLHWTPSEAVVTRVLDRLFRDVPSTGTAWERLLWATGRGSLPGRAALDSWRWHGTP